MPAKRTVLVVDDDRDFRDALEHALALEGFEVLLAGSGKAGIDVALERQPDVVLLDDGLPDGRGVDVLTELRARGFRRPVVMLSGTADRGSLRHPGATEVLLKPVDYDRLCGVLRTAAEKGDVS